MGPMPGLRLQYVAIVHALIGPFLLPQLRLVTSRLLLDLSPPYSAIQTQTRWLQMFRRVWNIGLYQTTSRAS